MIQKIIVADAVEGLKQIPSGTVNCCVTSPPYYGLRDYGVAGQIGLEASPEEYISRLVTVFREVWRVLRDDGTAWINIGDSYAGSGMGAANYPGETSKKQLTNKGSTSAKGRAGMQSSGFPHRSYMKISCAMLDACDAVYFLPDWRESEGAVYEFGRAVATGKEIINGIAVMGSGCSDCCTRHTKARA